RLPSWLLLWPFGPWPLALGPLAFALSLYRYAVGCAAVPCGEACLTVQQEIEFAAKPPRHGGTGPKDRKRQPVRRSLTAWDGGKADCQVGSLLLALGLLHYLFTAMQSAVPLSRAVRLASPFSRKLNLRLSRRGMAAKDRRRLPVRRSLTA